MPKPIDRQEPLIQDTLARIEALGESDRRLEREAGVPQGFLKKSRQGKNRHETSAPSWAKLRVWLANRGAVGRGMDSEPAALESPSEIPPGLPASAGDIDKLALEIAAIGTSAKRHREALQNLSIAVILGRIPDHKRAEIALQTLKAMQAAIKLEKFEGAQERLGELELMTEDEVEAFRAWSETRAPRPLAPGESARPPAASP